MILKARMEITRASVWSRSNYFLSGILLGIPLRCFSLFFSSFIPKICQFKETEKLPNSSIAMVFWFWHGGVPPATIFSTLGKCEKNQDKSLQNQRSESVLAQRIKQPGKSLEVFLSNPRNCGWNKKFFFWKVAIVVFITSEHTCPPLSALWTGDWRGKWIQFPFRQMGNSIAVMSSQEGKHVMD